MSSDPMWDVTQIPRLLTSRTQGKLVSAAGWGILGSITQGVRALDTYWPSVSLSCELKK